MLHTSEQSLFTVDRTLHNSAPLLTPCQALCNGGAYQTRRYTPSEESNRFGPPEANRSGPPPTTKQQSTAAPRCWDDNVVPLRVLGRLLMLSFIFIIIPSWYSLLLPRGPCLGTADTARWTMAHGGASRKSHHTGTQCRLRENVPPRAKYYLTRCRTVPIMPHQGGKWPAQPLCQPCAGGFGLFWGNLFADKLRQGAIQFYHLRMKRHGAACIAKDRKQIMDRWCCVCVDTVRARTGSLIWLNNR